MVHSRPENNGKHNENKGDQNISKPHFGCWDVPLSTNTVRRWQAITVGIFLVTVTGSLYMVQSPQKSLCWGDDPPTIRNTRNLHPGTTSRIKKHELAAPWSMRVFLHCAFLWRQCQLLVQLSNVSDSKQTKTNPSPLNRETGKDCWTIWNFLGWIQFQVLQNLAVTQPL